MSDIDTSPCRGRIGRRQQKPLSARSRLFEKHLADNILFDDTRKAKASKKMSKASKKDTMAAEANPTVAPAPANPHSLPPLYCDPNIDPQLFDPYDPHPDAPKWPHRLVDFAADPAVAGLPTYAALPTYGALPNYAGLPTYAAGPSYAARPSFAAGNAFAALPSFAAPGPSFTAGPSFAAPGPSFIRSDRPITPPPHPRTVLHNTTPTGTPPPDFETGVLMWRLSFNNPTAAKYTIRVKAALASPYRDQFREVSEFELQPQGGHVFRTTRVAACEWWQTRRKEDPLYVITAEFYNYVTRQTESFQASVDFDNSQIKHADVDIVVLAGKPQLKVTFAPHPDDNCTWGFKTTV